jgi:hypothetical protein
VAGSARVVIGNDIQRGHGRGDGRKSGRNGIGIKTQAEEIAGVPLTFTTRTGPLIGAKTFASGLLSKCYFVKFAIDFAENLFHGLERHAAFLEFPS